jgi:hypothetical protein
MNPETVTLIERSYQEIVDDIVTAIVGGVVNEPIIFDVKEDLYPLAQPASDVRGITGTVKVDVPNGEPKLIHQTFQKTVDFVFSANDNAIVWQPRGVHPADETIFYADYFRPASASRSPLSDINVGSVTRTLSEAIGREIATVYQQINQAYLAGFVNTAQGQALELVVSILGVKRITKDFPVGLVTFFRDPGAANGNITIPEAVLLSTAKGEANFVTVESRMLQRGQVRVDVPVRATMSGDAGIVAAGAITTLSQPISGIVRVTNFDATVRAAEDETDTQLRNRAKAVLRGLGKATIAALSNAIIEQSAKLAEAFDPNGPPGKRTDPGTVTLLIESKSERFPSVRNAVEQTRAAGVLTTLVARYVFLKPRITLTSTVSGAGKAKLVQEVIAKMQEYVDGLSAGDPAKGEELLKGISSVKDVKAPKIVDVIARRSDIGSAGPEPLLKVILDTINPILATGAGVDATARSAALSAALTDALFATSSTVPTDQRITDRALVQGTGSQHATDAEIEAGQFRVSAIVGGEKWWIVLDVEPSDIVVTAP